LRFESDDPSTVDELEYGPHGPKVVGAGVRALEAKLAEVVTGKKTIS
jgi:hypothetical protein